MPKKKGQKKNIPRDFTINDSANAPKPVARVKKSTTEVTWDQIADNDLDIVEEINEDGTKNIVYKKKRNNSKCEDNIDERPGNVYPEIIWYWISQFIKPDDIGNFAGINRATYFITRCESFWRGIYRRYCEKHPKLPEKLQIDTFRAYGLRQRVIRALYHTHDEFIKKVAQQAAQDSKPHDLVKRRCVSVWYCKGAAHWSIYFKLKKMQPTESVQSHDFFEELGRIDANPEENTQVLQVNCQHFYEVPPLMGMTLSSVSVVLSQGFRHHRLHLGFNTGSHNVSKDILPECTVVLDKVVNIFVFDWWHPKYPHFDNNLPINVVDEESLPVLKKDFFATRDADL
ncbi:transmembrane protein 183 [Manduca sexta]|uniref:transmembrane protein 183 n=1 Tax=Manduca sexta TaxID=7130 RepID=UPI0018909BA6|nr:transmembrane protein 183 [Manduca sexta]